MNDAARSGVSYVGIDKEQNFREQWRALSGENIRFQVADARSFDGLQNMSLACSLFTLQFIPERDRMHLLRQLHDGLIEGGALIIAEKVFANSARFQDILTFDYYDFKRKTFSSEEIMNKERSLRGQMCLWSEPRLVVALCDVGFQAEAVHRFWQNYLFIGIVAVKCSARPVVQSAIARLSAA